VDIWVQWKESGESRQFRAEQLIRNSREGKPMKATHWIFTGSVMHKNTYLAAIEKSLIATYRDPVAIINNPLPDGANDVVHEANPEVVPEVGTLVTMIIKAVGKKNGE
jgi:hypothetical protein